MSVIVGNTNELVELYGRGISLKQLTVAYTGRCRWSLAGEGKVDACVAVVPDT